MKRKSQENRNERSEDDVDYAVAIFRRLLKLIGILPVRRYAKKWEKIGTRVLATINFGLISFLLIPILIRVYLDVSCGQLDSLLNVAAALNFYALGVIKFWMLIARKEEVSFCFERLEEDWGRIECQEDWQIMKKTAKIGRNYSILCITLTYGGGFSYNVVLPVVAKSIEKGDNSTEKHLPYPSYYGFIDDQSSPANEILFVTQTMTSILTISINSGVYSFAAACVMHACGQFRIVGEYLKRLAAERDIFTMRKQMKSIIQQHERAFRYAKNIEDTFNIIFLSDMIGCTVVICFLEYYFMKSLERGETSSTLAYMTLIAYVSFSVFILSFMGQQLKDESQKVGVVTYIIEWYRLPHEIVQNLMFVMIRTNRPSRISAGKLFDLSYNSFADVMKTSIAYLNFLRTLVV